MWKLVCERKPDVVHYLIVGKEYNIGRRDCEIIIPDDMSISRKHAVIKILHPEENLVFPERKSILHFRDVSKLGTQLKDGRISNGAERNLEDGDLLIFGTAGISRYRAVYDPLIVTTSCLVQGSKKDVKRNVLKLGGHIVNEWCKDCQMVIMNNLSVTMKVISALLSLKPVATPQYLDDLVKAIEGSTKLPNVEDYLPGLSESQVNSADVSFGPDPRRQTLFSGKTFVFLSPSQYKKLHFGLELGGAKTMLVTNANEVKEYASAEGSCIMLPDAAGSQVAASLVQAVQTVLTRLKRRMIAESEIGFAVLYCSTAVHCNAASESAVPSCGLPPQSLSQNPMQLNSVLITDPSQSTVQRYPEQSTSEQNKTSSKTMLPPMKIKEEPLSQPVAKQKTSKDLKRPREDSELSTEATVPQDSVSFKKCRIESKDESVGIVSSVISHVDDSSTIAVSSGGKPRHGVNTAEKPKQTEDLRSSVRQEATESLDMDFSIGSIYEQLTNERETKTKPAQTKLINKSPEAKNKKIDDDEFWKSSMSFLSQRISEEPEKKPVVKKQDQDCKKALPFLGNDSSKARVNILPGFLTAALPIRIETDPDFVKMEDLPCNVVVTEVKSLVVRKPVQRRREAVSDEAMVTWMGRLVKNFKKFKKVHGSVSVGLPRIIGGKDLIVHESVPTAERENLFRNELEAESQQENSQQQWQELASWQPLSRRR